MTDFAFEEHHLDVIGLLEVRTSFGEIAHKLGLTIQAARNMDQLHAAEKLADEAMKKWKAENADAGPMRSFAAAVKDLESYIIHKRNELSAK